MYETLSPTGTTWAQELIWLLNTNAELKKALSVPVYERIRYIEYNSEGLYSGLEMVALMVFI